MPTRKEYAGGAPATTLASGINNSTTAIPLTSGTGYPTGASYPFVICIDRGLSTEEKVLCDSRSGNNITANASGRGYDGTAASAHASGATVEHVLDAATVTDLTTIAYQAAVQAVYALTPAADKLPYFTSGSAAALADITAGGRAVVGVTGAANKVPVWSSASAASAIDFTAGAWTSYTPIVQQPATLTASSEVGAYARFGRFIVGRAAVTVSSAGTTANDVISSLPVTPATGVVFVGWGEVERTGVAVHRAGVKWVSGVAVQFAKFDDTTGAHVGATPAFGLVSGDKVRFNFAYEAAS